MISEALRALLCQRPSQVHDMTSIVELFEYDLNGRFL